TRQPGRPLRRRLPACPRATPLRPNDGADGPRRNCRGGPRNARGSNAALLLRERRQPGRHAGPCGIGIDRGAPSRPRGFPDGRVPAVKMKTASKKPGAASLPAWGRLSSLPRPDSSGRLALSARRLAALVLVVAATARAASLYEQAVAAALARQFPQEEI